MSMLRKLRIRQNTERFVRGLPANNALLTGARGTGKSSLIRACLHEFSAQGLRLIEVDKRDLIDIADIVDIVAERAEHFIIFCDDLSFDTNEAGYKELKAALDGSIAGTAEECPDLCVVESAPSDARADARQPEYAL